MKIPFFITDEDWKNLRPKAEVNPFGQRPKLPDEQENFLAVFKVVDLRVEWVCSKMVFVFNASLLMLAVVGLQLLGFSGPQIWSWIIEHAGKIFGG